MGDDGNGYQVTYLDNEEVSKQATVRVQQG
jgi:hypothetical protein